jgi:outer membrane protein TolC
VHLIGRKFTPELNNRVKIIKFALFLGIVAFCAAGAKADPPGSVQDGTARNISLAEALTLAETGNYDLRVAGYQKDQVDADFRKSSSVFLPQINLYETSVSTDDPLMVFGFKLKEEMVTAADFNPATLNNPPSFQNFQTKIELQQPLINPDGFYGRHAAAKASDAAGAKWERTRRGTELGVKNSYFGLVVALRSLEVVSSALAAATAYRDQAKDFHDRGMISRSDYLMADVRVLELEMKKVETENAIRDSGDDLRTMLGLADSVNLVPTDTLSLLAVGDLGFDKGEVFSTRSDLVAMRHAVDAAAAGLSMQRAGWLPSLNAFASYELNDDTFAGAQGRSWMVGAVAKWTILQGYDRIGGIEKAAAQRSALETEYEKMQSNASHDLSSARGNLESARRRAGLAAKAVEQAAESFRVLSDRYESGLERTSDLLQAEASLLNARLTHLQAVYQHNASVYMMEFLLERKVSL